MGAAPLFKTKGISERELKKECENVIPMMPGFSEKQKFSLNTLIAPGALRSRAEMKTMIGAIDRELGKHKSIAELDFIAGYLTGKIYEKEINDFLTHRQAEQLKNILYAKYEAMRTLEEPEE